MFTIQGVKIYFGKKNRDVTLKLEKNRISMLKFWFNFSNILSRMKFFIPLHLLWGLVLKYHWGSLICVAK